MAGETASGEVRREYQIGRVVMSGGDSAVGKLLSRGASTSQVYSFAVTSLSRLPSLSTMATLGDLGVEPEQVMMMSSRNKVK